MALASAKLSRDKRYVSLAILIDHYPLDPSFSKARTVVDMWQVPRKCDRIKDVNSVNLLSGITGGDSNLLWGRARRD